MNSARTFCMQLTAAFLFLGSAFAGNEKSTEVVHSAFSLSLPGEWSLVSEPADEILQYVSNDEREAVTISVYGRPGAPDKGSMRRDFDELVAIIQRAEANAEGLTMEIGESKVTKEKGVLYGLHAGSSADGKHRTVTRVAMNQHLAVVVLYEANGLDDEDRALRGATVLFSLELKKRT